MKKFIQNLIAIIILCAVVFYFRFSLRQAYLMTRDKVFPCDFPIAYSIDKVDDHFGISEDQFLLSVEKAESIWDNAIGKKLFVYAPNNLPLQAGDLKVSLLYDDRQATTDKLKNIGSNLEDRKNSYESLKSEYDTLYKEYLQDKDNIKTRSDAEVFNKKVNRLNELSKEMRDSAENVNEKVNEYNNTLDAGLGSEFEEGIYFAGKNGRGINIYEFKDSDNLVRVLAHEMGHALSLEHLDDPKAIMYYVNSGDNLTLSESDISALKAHCGIK